MRNATDIGEPEDRWFYTVWATFFVGATALCWWGSTFDVLALVAGMWLQPAQQFVPWMFGSWWRHWRGPKGRKVLKGSSRFCVVCGLATSETDLDIYYRYGFTHEDGTRYAEPGSEIYEQRKAEHTHG